MTSTPWSLAKFVWPFTERPTNWMDQYVARDVVTGDLYVPLALIGPDIYARAQRRPLRPDGYDLLTHEHGRTFIPIPWLEECLPEFASVWRRSKQPTSTFKTLNPRSLIPPMSRTCRARFTSVMKRPADPPPPQRGTTETSTSDEMTLEQAANFPVTWGRYARYGLTIGQVSRLYEPSGEFQPILWLANSFYQAPKTATPESLEALRVFLMAHYRRMDSVHPWFDPTMYRAYPQGFQP